MGKEKLKKIADALEELRYESITVSDVIEFSKTQERKARDKFKEAEKIYLAHKMQRELVENKWREMHEQSSGLVLAWLEELVTDYTALMDSVESVKFDYICEWFRDFYKVFPTLLDTVNSHFEGSGHKFEIYVYEEEDEYSETLENGEVIFQACSVEFHSLVVDNKEVCKQQDKDVTKETINKMFIECKRLDSELNR